MSDPVRRGVLAGIALVLGAMLKRFYSHAGFDELTWILAPTTALVTALTAARFELEAGSGYLCREFLFRIVPSCAGVNFLIATFWVLVAARLRRDDASGPGVLPSSAAVAYALTILANATRIALTLWLHRTGASWGVLTPDRLHRLAGVVVYLVYLLVAHAWIARRPASPVLLPLLGYLGVALAVPALNGAARAPGFGEHATTTLVVSGGIAAIWLGSSGIVRRLALRNHPR